MSVPSHLLRARPLTAPAGWLAMGALLLGAGAGSAFVATQFKGAAPFVLVGMFVAPLLAIGIVVNPLLAILVVVATFPVGNIALLGGPVQGRVVEAAVFVCGLVIILRRLAVGRIPLPFAAPLGWAVALFLWTMISIFSAIDERLALKVLFSLLGGIVCATVVLAACRDMRDLRILLAGFVSSGVAIGLLTFSQGRHVGQFATSFGGSEVVSGRLQGAFDSPNQLGAFCALMIPVAAALIFGARTARWRLAAGMALVILLVTLMLSLSRGAWVGAGLALLFMLVKLKEARRLLVILAVPLMIVGFFVWSLTPTKADVKVVGQRARALTVLSPYDNRRIIYKEAFREIRTHPVLGVGPGGFQVASTRVVSESATLSYLHAHNLYLNWAAEVGVPSVIIILCFAGALGFAARTASRGARIRGDPRDRAIVIGISAALLTVLIQGFFDYVIPNPVVYMAFWTLVGALLVARREALISLRAAG